MVQNVYGRPDRTSGSAQWMAPELLTGKSSLTYASDVYALAMTLYELWFDKDPFDLMDAGDVADMVGEAGIRPDKETSPAIHDGFWDLLEACWDEDPDARFASYEVSAMMLSMTAGTLGYTTATLITLTRGIR